MTLNTGHPCEAQFFEQTITEIWGPDKSGLYQRWHDANDLAIFYHGKATGRYHKVSGEGDWELWQFSDGGLVAIHPDGKGILLIKEPT